MPPHPFQGLGILGKGRGRHQGPLGPQSQGQAVDEIRRTVAAEDVGGVYPVMLPQGLPQGAATGVGVLCHVFDGLPHGLLYALRRTQGADVGGKIETGQCVVFGLVGGPVAAVVSFSHQIPPQNQTAQRTRPSKTRPSTPPP